MRVVIITEGGEAIGFGHVTRCVSIYQSFVKHGIFPEFIIDGDEGINDVMRGIEYNNYNWKQDKDALYKVVDGCDIAVIDSYLAPVEIYERLSKMVKFPVYLDDYRRLDYPAGYILNWSIAAKELGYPDRNGKNLLGIDFLMLRQEFCDVPAREISEEIKTVLITFGGDDLHNMTPLVIEMLNKNFPTLKQNIILGNSFSKENVSKIRKVAGNRAILRQNLSAAEMKEIMLNSDIAITAGGQTLGELASCRLPALVIAIAENQMNIISGWQKAGSIRYTGWWEEAGLLNKLKEEINAIKGCEIREQMSANGKRAIPDQKEAQLLILIMCNN